MQKQILISAFSLIVLTCAVVACQKSQNEIETPSSQSEQKKQDAGERSCTYTPDCSLDISQTSSASGAWDLAVSVQRTGCSETEIECYRGDNANAACQNIASSIGTFDLIPNTTYRLYYSGNYPRTFKIGQSCAFASVTFTSTSPNPYELSSALLDYCDIDCN